MICHAVARDPQSRRLASCAILALACDDGLTVFSSLGAEQAETTSIMLQKAENQEKSRYLKPPIFAVAPMIDWMDAF